MEEKKLIKIPLQFFGEDDEDLDDGYFDDDDGYFDDIPDTEEDYPDETEEGGDGSDDGADESATENAEASDAPEQEKEDAKGTTEESELISELRALGYVGDDIKSLTADMKARREKRAELDASKERRAVNSAGKSHIKSGRPGKGASGDGTGGVTERQVIGFAERTGCTKEEARRLLGKHARMMS